MTNFEAFSSKVMAIFLQMLFRGAFSIHLHVTLVARSQYLMWLNFSIRSLFYLEQMSSKNEDLTLIAVGEILATLRVVGTSAHCPPSLLYFKILSELDPASSSFPPKIMKESACSMTPANLSAWGRLLPEMWEANFVLFTHS